MTSASSSRNIRPSETTRSDLLTVNNRRTNIKFIKCPTCQEMSLVNFKEYKINIICENQEHINNNILLENYESTQKIKNEFNCNECNKNKIGQFYICQNCSINLCKFCYKKHSNENREHKIIESELINFICLNHSKEFTFYCKECNKNLCDLCTTEHINGHGLIELKNLSKNLDKNYIDELKQKKEKLKENIEEIIDMLI